MNVCFLLKPLKLRRLSWSHEHWKRLAGEPRPLRGALVPLLRVLRSRFGAGRRAHLVAPEERDHPLGREGSRGNQR